MKLHKTRESLLDTLSSYRQNKTIGFVPTMGALHRGHLALIAQSVSENDITVVSIFVNPTQFNNQADLEKYPRTLENDLQLLKTLTGNLVIFAPTAEVVYDQKVLSKSYDFGGLENEMEGKHRPGHFDGVGTVLNIFFRLIRPNRAYFGEKDFQQLQIVKKLVEIEKLNVDVIGCPIVRETNGLALSSRNQRLSQAEREEAALLYQTLVQIRENFSNYSLAELNEMGSKAFANNAFLSLEYFEIANATTLKTAERKVPNTAYRAFLAVFAGDVRLIDNMQVSPQ
ncbi:pantoate--beta-alanine ligase [Flavobacteriaceae bacterium TK19130]|nr:pantoate--beta-alanine ligase [Thermobacterium salinum]